MQSITLHPGQTTRPILKPPSSTPAPDPTPKNSKTDTGLSTASTPTSDPNTASLYFIGTATTILHWRGLHILTDPNFLHAGDHVHLGPGVTGTRRTNPAIDLEALPPIDLVLLSHYHADHFDQDVEQRLRRDLPIVTTPHAKEHLQSDGAEKGSAGPYTALTALETWESAMVDVEDGAAGAAQEGSNEGKKPKLKVTAMPGKHVPPGPGGVLGKLNDLAAAVPPTNGWMLELGHESSEGVTESFESGYRIYITGDTLLIDELHDIPSRYNAHGKPIDLMLMHLGGTTIPGPSMPLLMVTMDAKQGVQLLKIIGARKAIPIHYDDYDVFLSGLDEFKEAVQKAGLTEKVEYLDRGEEFRFVVRET